MSALFTPLTLRSLEIPNRVWMSPMCMYSAAAQGPRPGRRPTSTSPIWPPAPPGAPGS